MISVGTAALIVAGSESGRTGVVTAIDGGAARIHLPSGEVTVELAWLLPAQANELGALWLIAAELAPKVWDIDLLRMATNEPEVCFRAGAGPATEGPIVVVYGPDEVTAMRRLNEALIRFFTFGR